MPSKRRRPYEASAAERARRMRELAASKTPKPESTPPETPAAEEDVSAPKLNPYLRMLKRIDADNQKANTPK